MSDRLIVEKTEPRMTLGDYAKAERRKLADQRAVWAKDYCNCPEAHQPDCPVWKDA